MSSSTKSKSSSSNKAQTKKLSLSKNIFHYLELLPKPALLQLYTESTYGPYTCRAVLQSAMPEMARQYILRLAVCGGIFSKKDMALWHNTFGKRDASLILKRMEAFAIVESTPPPASKSNDDSSKGGEEDPSSSSSLQSQLLQTNVCLTMEFKSGILKSISSLTSAPWEPITPHHLQSLQSDPTTPLKNRKPPPTMGDLEYYTQRRWESVLHYLVGSSDTSIEEPPEGVKSFLESTGLMQDDPEYSEAGSTTKLKNGKPPLIITSKGYEFMLQDTHIQVWQFLLQLLLSFAKYEQSETLRQEALLFVFALSYCKVGEGYLTRDLSPSHQEFLRFFRQLGLLYTTKIAPNLTAFYPTRVSVSLVAGSNDASSRSNNDKEDNEMDGHDSYGDENPSNEQDDPTNSTNPSASSTRVLEAALANPKPSSSHIGIIVQTNFQLCAYTTSPLHLSMLGLFCNVLNYRRLPNVIFYQITRDSVKQAFRLGITAHQILRFLKMHAHPRLRNGEQPLVPTNIQDQIWLWDREQSRVQMKEVYVHQCTGADEFKAVSQFAKDKGAYAWGSETGNRIMIVYDRAEYILAYVRHWKARKIHRVAQRQSSYG